MKRRDFLVATSSGIVALSGAKCSTSGGMTMTKLGRTDVPVSKFCFGSHYFHLHPDMKDQVEREKVIRTAYERGVTTFDIYNSENNYFQYEPMSRYLAPILNEVQISIAIRPEEGRSYEEQFFHTLKLFKRDSFDMVRLRAATPSRKEEWAFWERLFRLREEGYIRAAGIAIHNVSDLDVVLNTFRDDMDFVIFPYNFYHNNWRTGPNAPAIQDFETFEKALHDSGVGIVAMKTLSGDWLTPVMKEAAAKVNPDIVYTQACLKYVLNSSLNPHTLFVGMNHLDEFEQNMPAFENPRMTDEETALLGTLREVAKTASRRFLPAHYRFLDDWAPRTLT